MPEIKKSTIIILTIAVLFVSMVLGVEGVFSSSDLDFICDVDNSILYRTAGQWICSVLPAGTSEATTTTLGTVKVINCTGTDKLSGYSATNVPVCTTDSGSGGTVTSISQATGITINPNPLVATGTIMLSNATTSAIGGVRVANCTGSDKFSSYAAGNIPTCSADSNSGGTVTSISQGTGMSLSPNPITTTGTIHLANATNSIIGGTRVTNCSQGQFISGFDGSMNPICNIPTTNGYVETGNRYCNPQSTNEYCEFYDFGGGDLNRMLINPPKSVLSTIGADGAGCIDANLNIFTELYGKGTTPCVEGFLPLGINSKTTTTQGVHITFSSGGTNGVSESPFAAYCNIGGVQDYNCTKIVNTSNIIEYSIRFSNYNIKAQLSDDMNLTMLIGFYQGNFTSGVLDFTRFLPNGLQNVIGFYHYRNDSNWSAITMSGGNASNQTTVLPLDFNSTADITMFNTFRIIRENTTGDMLFYINETLVANHSTFIPPFTAFGGSLVIVRHGSVNGVDFKWLEIDWMKYYRKKTSSYLVENFTGSFTNPLIFVKQISLFEGLSSNESPITSNATLMLNNASELLNGGVKVFNCTGNGHVSGWLGNMTPRCSDNGNSTGTVTSISQGTGMSFSVDPLITTGTINIAEATTSVIGGVKVANCTTGYYLNGFNATNIPNCVGELNNGTVTSITASTGLSGGVITASGIIALDEALVATIGGVKIINCSANNFIQTYAAGVVPTCATFTETGTVSSLTSSGGITLNPTTITSTGVIMVSNATTTQAGAVRVLNCSGNGHISGYDSDMNPFCSDNGNSTGTVTSISQFEGITLNPNPITTTGGVMLSNATTITIGGVRVLNCSGNGHISGYDSSMNPFCSANDGNGTVTSITASTGLSGGVITSSGTIALLEALIGTIGGVKVANCTAGSSITGYSASNIPICTAGGTGTVTSIAVDSTITANPSPIIATGTLMATNATLTQLGVTKLTNCSTGFYLNGWNATNIPNCVGELKNGTVTSITASTGLSGGVITASGTIDLLEALTGTIGGVKVANCTGGQYVQGWSVTNTPICATVNSVQAQPLYEISNRQYGWIRPAGTTATTWTNIGLATVNSNGTASASGQSDSYYISHVTSSSSGAGVSQGLTQTQARYRPLVSTRVKLDSTITNSRIWFSLASNIVQPFTDTHGSIFYGLRFSTNASDTNWMCCSGDGTVAGSTCTSTGISVTQSSFYNLTLNMTTSGHLICDVQNVTNYARVDKTSNLDATETSNLGIQDFLQSISGAAKNFALNAIYFESK